MRYLIAFDKKRRLWTISLNGHVFAVSRRPTVLINRHPGADIDDLSAVQAHIASEVLAGAAKEKRP